MCQLLKTGFKVWTLTVMFLFAGLATADAQVGQMLDRVKRIERDLIVLQRQLYRGQVAISAGDNNAESNPSVSRTSIDRVHERISELEDVIRSLTGEIEKISFATSQVETRLNRIASDVDFRLHRIEEQLKLSSNVVAGEQEASVEKPVAQAVEEKSGKKAGFLGETRPDKYKKVSPISPLRPLPPTPTTALVEQLSEDSAVQAVGAEEQYKHAYNLLKQADYSAAEKALDAFIMAYPNHKFAGNAKYWLGETFYVRGDYERAAVAFADGYKKYKNNTKGPDNLLKLGLSLTRLGKKENACVAFKSVGVEFAKAPEIVSSRAVREFKKLGCK